jgi:hypothetical protein
MEIRIGSGTLTVQETCDPAYPGFDIEYVADNDIGETMSRPRVLIECNKETGELRVLIWNNPNSEDYTEAVNLAILPETIEKMEE